MPNGTIFYFGVGNGEEITVAHGGWMSAAHSRYERFKHAAVLSIPARMTGHASVFDDGTGQREIRTGRVSRGVSAESPTAAPISDSEVDSDDAPPVALADDDGPVQWGQGTPPGFRSERRTTGAVETTSEGELT